MERIVVVLVKREVGSGETIWACNFGLLLELFIVYCLRSYVLNICHAVEVVSQVK